MSEAEEDYGWGDESLWQASVVCKYCGETDLKWSQDKNSKWILLDSCGHKHICPKLGMQYDHQA